MAHQEGQESDDIPENWLSGFEDQCLEDFSSETNMDDIIQRETEYSVQKLFSHFQNSATAVAQLYKDQTHGLSLWIPFQNAASSVTTLYKDSVDTARHCVDLGVQTGKQRRTRDIISWVKKRRRHIRREDLIAFLCGKSPPPRSRIPSGVVRHSQASRIERPFPRFSSADNIPNTTEPDLQAFREAIALQGLDGAMSNISMGYRPHSNPNASQISSLQRNNMEDLNSFILEEFSRNCDSRKRSATPDVTMDSPVWKKSRHF